MNTSATAYLRDLANVLQSVVVTDHAGVRLPIDEGSVRAVQLLMSVRASGHKVMVIGNGGSAAIASHTHNDLCKAVGVRALVFTETPLLTALSNDESYQVAYQRQIEHWADPGDLLIAISSSGASKNILNAADSAEKLGCLIFTLSGFAQDNPLRNMGDLNYYAPAREYGMVELAHSVLAHLWTDAAVGVLRNLHGGKNAVEVKANSVGAGRSGIRRGRVSA